MDNDPPEVPKNNQRISERAPLNPEIAKEAAKRLAEKEDQLADLLKPHFKGEEHKEAIDDNFIYTESDNGGFGISDLSAPFSGKYTRLSYIPDERFHSKVGVETKYRLYINEHTDEETMEQFLEEERRQGRRPQGVFETQYYFDHNGNYGKVSIFPNYIEDSREVLEQRTNVKTVVSKMIGGDFEMAGAALENLIKRLSLSTEKTNQELPKE